MGRESAAAVATVFMAFENLQFRTGERDREGKKKKKKNKAILVREIYSLIRGWCFARSPLSCHGLPRGQAWTPWRKTWHLQLPQPFTTDLLNLAKVWDPSILPVATSDSEDIFLYPFVLYVLSSIALSWIFKRRVGFWVRIV